MKFEPLVPCKGIGCPARVDPAFRHGYCGHHWRKLQLERRQWVESQKAASR